ncbi:MAG TPA: amino acid adenylation domain-containing protein [Ktedonobacteraceae bacterium]|jgi:amino acid adenylation domain-containing protein
MPESTELSEARRALLDKLLRGSTPSDDRLARPIKRQSAETSAPLSFGQQQIWLLAQLIPEVPVYNECVTLHLPGPLNVGVFEQSFAQILRRHAAWRTSFPLVDGLPVQYIHPPVPLALQVTDLRHLPATARLARAFAVATEDSQLLFDLAQGPLLRARLVRLSANEHRLFLTMHHIIFDGVAIYQILLPELFAVYQALLAGEPSPLPALSLAYTDYACWQREQAQGEAFNAHLAYWKELLAHAPATLQLPTDRPRPQVSTYQGSMQPFALSRELSEALKVLSRQQGVTLYTTLAAAFNTLLYRLTGQEDLVIGTASAGRNRPELQTLMGYFLNTLVLRSDLSGNPTFCELLRRMRAVIAAAIAHEEVPFAYLVKELQPERDLSTHPLFQVLLTLEPPLATLPSGWTLTQMDVTVGTSKFDLSLELDDRPAGLIGRFEYNSDLFNADTIERMVDHWQTLLGGIVANPMLRLADLPLLTTAERTRLLHTWNDTQQANAGNLHLQQLFEAQVARTPQAIAVVYQDRQLTYHELNARANQLAHSLRELGVGSASLVGLCVERSPEMVIGLLAILKAGGAYVPLDPTYPAERLAFMLEDSQAEVLLTQQHLVAQLPADAVRIVCLDSDPALLSEQSQENPLSAGTPEQLAYVIYTSGSTGRPKGVQIPHRALCNLLSAMRQQPGISAADTLLAVTTLSFDIAGLEIFLPLIAGARLVVAGRDTVADGAALAQLLACTHATIMQATPVTWRLLLAAGWQGDTQLKILCGGEALPADLASQLIPECASLWNMYGPTETTIWSSCARITSVERNISIGQPIANTQMYVLDPEQHLVPVGVSGELFIGGAGLAHGYLHRPELTAERFLNHSFERGTQMRLYRTGDLARYRADGTLEILGRLDYQVKLRGFRIEPGEIEATLEHHPAVRQALVVLREDTPGTPRLVAYVIPEAPHTPTARELLQALARQLPAYMLPAALVLLDTLPLTLNGKVDRQALPAPAEATGTPEVPAGVPTLLIHHQLLQIWQELLGTQQCGIQSNFFRLGGHSLLAARLINRIEQVFHKQLPLATLFANPTIEQLAAVLLQEQTQAPPDFGPAHSSARAPVVTVQAGLDRRPFFYLHGNWDDTAFYCFTLAHQLGFAQPFYVLAPYIFTALAVAPTCETIAAAHIAAMRAVQPHGPYLLGGFCNGGVIAFEIAQQLHAQGETVDLLALIEPGVAPFSLRFSRQLIQVLGRLFRLSAARQLDAFLRMRHAIRWTFPRNWGTLPLFPSREALRQDETGVYSWVAAAYRHREYPGKVTFLWASVKRNSRRALWGEVNTRGAHPGESYIIPGSHFDLILDHLHLTAARLRKCLTGAQARPQR